MMYRIIAFDMDGTIADTIPMCIKAFFNGVSPYTDHELGEDEILRTFGLDETGMVKAVVSRNWEAALKNFYVQYELLHDEVTEPFPGIVDLILFLKKHNITVALITGKGERSCRITLEKLGLSDTFDEILCGSQLSPNKEENMRFLLEKYAVSKDEFCYVGDTIQDISACRRAGVRCLSAAWQKNADSAALKKKNSDYTFRTVLDLYDYFRKNIIFYQQ